jgi:hypothetical protein
LLVTRGSLDGAQSQQSCALSLGNARQARDVHALILAFVPQRMDARAVTGIPHPDQPIITAAGNQLENG